MRAVQDWQSRKPITRFGWQRDALRRLQQALLEHADRSARMQAVVTVAPAEQVQRLQGLLEQCREAVAQLRRACAERDDALRAKDVTIARLAGQLADLQAE